MATYFPSPGNKRDDLSTNYVRDSVYTSYPEAPNLLPGNMMMYVNDSIAETYSNALAGNSQLPQNFVALPSVGTLNSNPNNFGSHIEVQGYSAWRGERNGMSSTTGLSQIHSNLSLDGIRAPTGTISSSKYLMAAQELLDEVVIVKALKQHESQRFSFKISKENESGSKNSGALSHTSGTSNQQESQTNPVCELSQAEKQATQKKMSNLLFMLDEIDRRYKQYSHQMQIVVSSFDLIAGCGASKRYTALALQVISNQFRCLRDAINSQIKATRKSLGDQDAGDNGSTVGISRLRFVDQQLRQQRTLQQFGMLQSHAWRPQRGLPESSVSVLRAWLFEHFLHPYPKDSDKTMLAKQAGLTRSQVSNWFINARVRLWKPMVEEMYKEEICDTEMESNSSLHDAIKATTNEFTALDSRGELLLQYTESAATDRCQLHNQFNESNSNLVRDVTMSGPTAGASADDCSSRKDMFIQFDRYNTGRFMDTATGYQIAELGRLRNGGGVSLTLGLQHCDRSDLPISGTTSHNIITMRGDAMYNPDVSFLGTDTTNYCPDTGHQQSGFGSSHLLHDFVP